MNEKIEIAEYLAKLQARIFLQLCCALSPSFSSVLAKRTSAQDNHALACNFAKYSARGGGDIRKKKGRGAGSKERGRERRAGSSPPPNILV